MGTSWVSTLEQLKSCRQHPAEQQPHHRLNQCGKLALALDFSLQSANGLMDGRQR
jgi:hypothetical protein